VVVSAAPEAGPVDPADLVAVVAERTAGGERLKDACKAVGREYGVPNRELYEAVLAARG
jgi:16S rRNA (cytidine1402-2'-O)-methyltransferase